MFRIICMHLDRAISEVGSQAELAKCIGVHPMAVSQWKRRGRIPAERVLAIAKATDWRITPHELAPDIYPDPNDGLPQHMRRCPEREDAA